MAGTNHFDGGMILNLKNYIRQAFAWWWAEIVSTLPGSVQSWLSNRRQPLRIRMEGTSLSVSAERPSHAVNLEFAITDYDDVTAAARQISKWLNKENLSAYGAIVYLPADCVLTSLIEIPVDAAGNLAEVMLAEIELQTPFVESEVYHNFKVISSDPDHDILTVELNVARIADVVHASQIATAAGLPDVVVCKQSEDDPVTGNFAPIPTQKMRTSLEVWIVAGLAVTIVILVAVAFYLPMDHLRQVSRLADSQIATLKSENVKLLQSADTVKSVDAAFQRLVTRKSQQPSTIGILSELTQFTPDHSWLIQVQINGSRLMVSGFSSDATGLIRSLEKSEVIKDANFSAPVTTNSDTGLDRVHITAELALGDAL